MRAESCTNLKFVFILELKERYLIPFFKCSILIEQIWNWGAVEIQPWVKPLEHVGQFTGLSSKTLFQSETGVQIPWESPAVTTIPFGIYSRRTWNCCVPVISIISWSRTHMALLSVWVEKVMSPNQTPPDLSDSKQQRLIYHTRNEPKMAGQTLRDPSWRINCYLKCRSLCQKDALGSGAGSPSWLLRLWCSSDTQAAHWLVSCNSTHPQWGHRVLRMGELGWLGEQHWQLHPFVVGNMHGLQITPHSSFFWVIFLWSTFLAGKTSSIMWTGL